MNVEIIIAQLPLICVAVIVSLLAYFLFKIRKQKKLESNFTHKHLVHEHVPKKIQTPKGIDTMTFDELDIFIRVHGTSIDGLLAMLVQVQKITETNWYLDRNYVFLRNLSILALFFDDCVERERKLLETFSPGTSDETLDTKTQLYEDIMGICFGFQIKALENKTMVFNTTHKTLVMKDVLYSGKVTFHVFPLNEIMRYGLGLGLKKKHKSESASQN